MPTTYDFLIIGSGILGLSLARALRKTQPKARIGVLEKEPGVGYHGSGRNSGVLHSGIYYQENSLKALLCAQGAKMLKDYCREHKLPMSELGKVILPVNEDDASTLDLLLKRAKANGAVAYSLDEKTLKEIEPNAFSITGTAIHVPECAVVDSKAILNCLVKELQSQGVVFHFDHKVATVSASGKNLTCANGAQFSFNHVVNAAGLYADQIASAFGIGKQYTIMPFKGLYYDLTDHSRLSFKGLIYPVPNLALPFLGVHFTKSVDGHVYIGPNAIPALGRENYHALVGAEALPTVATMWRNLGQYRRNEQGFRLLVHEEVGRLRKKNFVKAAKALVPKVTADDLSRSKKVGIRAQLFNRVEKKLVTDFLVENAENSTHILNAVSPGFTCGPSFADYVVKNYIK